MIELIMLNYLKNALYVPVYMEEPAEPQTDMYVVMEKTGSSQTNHINTATMAIQSYGGSMYEAAALNEVVKSAVENAIQLNEISAVRLNSDYNFTNTSTKRYRYQAVYVITYMEV